MSTIPLMGDVLWRVWANQDTGECSMWCSSVRSWSLVFRTAERCPATVVSMGFPHAVNGPPKSRCWSCGAMGQGSVQLRRERRVRDGAKGAKSVGLVKK